MAESIYGDDVADHSSLLWGFVARHYSIRQLGPLQCHSTDEDLGDKEDVSSVDIEHTVVHSNEDLISSGSDHDEFAAAVANSLETFKEQVEAELQAAGDTTFDQTLEHAPSCPLQTGEQKPDPLKAQESSLLQEDSAIHRSNEDWCLQHSCILSPSPRNGDCLLTSLLAGVALNDESHTHLALVDLRLNLFHVVHLAQLINEPWVTISAADNEQFRKSGTDGVKDHVIAAARLFEIPFVLIQTDDQSVDPIEPTIQLITPPDYSAPFPGTEPMRLALLLHSGQHYDAAYLNYSLVDAVHSPLFNIESLLHHLHGTGGITSGATVEPMVITPGVTVHEPSVVCPSPLANEPYHPAAPAADSDTPPTSDADGDSLRKRVTDLKEKFAESQFRLKEAENLLQVEVSLREREALRLGSLVTDAELRQAADFQLREIATQKSASDQDKLLKCQSTLSRVQLELQDSQRELTASTLLLGEQTTKNSHLVTKSQKNAQELQQARTAVTTTQASLDASLGDSTRLRLERAADRQSWDSVVEGHRQSLTQLEAEVAHLTGERNVAVTSLALFQAQAAHSNVSVASGETHNTTLRPQTSVQIRQLKTEVTALRKHITTLVTASQELQDSLEAANDTIGQYHMHDSQPREPSDAPPSAVTIPDPAHIGDTAMEAIRELSSLRAQMTKINGFPDDISNVNWQQIASDLLNLTEFQDLESLAAQRLCVVLRKERAVVEYTSSEATRHTSSDSGASRRNKGKLNLADVTQHNIHAELKSLLSDLFGNPPPLDDLMNRFLNGPGSDDILQHLVERVVDLDERCTVVLLKFVLSTAEQTRHTHLSGHRKKVVKEEPSADLDQLRLDFTDLTSRARSQERSHSEDLIKIQAAHQASHRETVALYESKMDLLQPASGRPDARASVLHARCLLLQSEVDATRCHEDHSG